MHRRLVLKSFLLIGLLASVRLWFCTTKAGAKKKAPVSRLGPAFRCAAGNWGILECERLALEPHEQFLSINAFNQPMRWHFKGYSRQQAVDFLVSAGVTRAELEPANRWNEENAGVVYTPTRELIIGLSDSAREKIYNTLATFPDHATYFATFVFPPQYVPCTLRHPTVPAEAAKLFRKLMYRQGEVLAFSDVPAVLAMLPDDAAKSRFLQMLVRRPTLLVHLKLNGQSNISELAEYWGAHGRTAIVRPILESAAAVPGGAEIDIADLLPPLARDRIQTFPSSANPLEMPLNCHWTSLNFFNDPPTDSFLYADGVEKELSANYVKTTSPALGDVILFRDASQVIVHSAAFIADKIIFTKNGVGTSQPWAFMTLEDAVACYTAVMGPLSLTAYRRKLV